MYSKQEIKDLFKQRGYGAVVQYLHPGTWDVEDEVHTDDVDFVYEAQFNQNALVRLDL